MELIVRICWLLVALVHSPPAAVLFAPQLVEQLYGVSAVGETGVLIVHRGALFLAILTAALFATFDIHSRRLASIVAAVSMIGFLFVYLRAGSPAGPLRTIALMDAIALLPLTFAGWRAWTPSRGQRIN
ncbi:MAG: hypothetical protein AAFW81_10475 [Pseudomonadota bacterium]